MSVNFKVKSKKVDKRKNQVVETLDSKHFEMIKQIESIKETLPALEHLLAYHEKKLQEYHTQKTRLYEAATTTTTSEDEQRQQKQHTLTDEIYVSIYHEEETIQKLKMDILKIKNNDYMNEYFLKTGHLLYEYYDGQKADEEPEEQEEDDGENEDDDDGENDGEEDDEDDGETSKEQEQEEEQGQGKKEKESAQVSIVKKTKITDYIEKDQGFDKANMYNRYIQLINNQTFIHKDIMVKKNNQGTICPKCLIELTLLYSEGLQVCNMCGLTEYILIDSEKPSFREPPPEVSYFAYKRINHFNEWLSQFQAKESTEIPPQIYQLILAEMKKERIADLNKITHTKIREYLKKLKLNKYYEHIPHILNKLNKKVPIIGKEVEDKLRHMFKEIQAPFMKICPPTRKNFLSYSYVLHKFVELLGLDHLKEAFHLLKSREKLHQQDQMWKEICKELNWMYIKSI